MGGPADSWVAQQIDGWLSREMGGSADRWVAQKGVGGLAKRWRLSREMRAQQRDG